MKYHFVRSAVGMVAGLGTAIVVMVNCSVHPDTIRWVTYSLAPIMTILVVIDQTRLESSFFGELPSEESSTDESFSEGNSPSQSRAAPQETTLQTTLEEMCNRRNFYRVVKGTIGLSVLALIAMLLLYVSVDPNVNRLLARSAIAGSPLVTVGVYLLVRPRVDQIVAS